MNKKVNVSQRRKHQNESNRSEVQENGTSIANDGSKQTLTTKGHTELKSVFYFILDWANLCTLLGAVCSCVSIVYISQEK